MEQRKRRRSPNFPGLARSWLGHTVRLDDCKPACRISCGQFMPAISRPALVFAGVVCFIFSPASAHDVSGSLSAGSAWTYDPWLLAPLYLVGICFYVGTLRLWRTAGFGRGIGSRQAAA